jgi:hypothetical protein
MDGNPPAVVVYVVALGLAVVLGLLLGTVDGTTARNF